MAEKAGLVPQVFVYSMVFLLQHLPFLDLTRIEGSNLDRIFHDSYLKFG